MESITNRIQVLDGFVKGQVETDDVHTSLLTRDGLMDSLLALFDECSHDNLMKNKHVLAFVKKCKQENNLICTFMILLMISVMYLYSRV